MSTLERRREAIVEVAAAWHDPDYPARTKAIEATADAPNRWTEAALTYAVSRWTHRFTSAALERWIGSSSSGSQVVGVLHGGADPLEGLRDAIAVWCSGHTYLGVVSDASPALVRAFASDVAEYLSMSAPEFADRDEVLKRADAVMAQPARDDVEAVVEECEAHDIPDSRRLIRQPRHAIGLLDGHESEGERDRLAEDLLLYEGGGHRRLAQLWAPRDLPPDAYLESMAQFRGAFPVHPDTPGALEMQQAFLDARDEPHAYAEGLEFLVSRGEPEVHPPGHIRWSEYDDRSEVGDWIQEEAPDLYAVVAREGLHDQLPDAWPLRTPGGIHIPPLADDEGEKIVSFVQSLE